MELQKATGYQQYPEQHAEFEAITRQLVKLFAAKAADYGPMAIAGMGEVGITVRLWDKIARLLNLMGFNVQTGQINPGQVPKNESIDDTLLDLASYAIIMLVYRRGKWGK